MIQHHAAPSRFTRAAITKTVAVSTVVLALVVAMITTAVQQPANAQPFAVAAAGLDPAQLGQWCVDRKARGTAGLTTRAKNWLDDCIAIFGAGLTPAPSGSPSSSVSASPSASPSPSPCPSPAASPSPSPSPPPSPGACPVSGTNIPGGADPWGGCWPGPGNVGVPAGTVLTAYTGPCTITAAGTVIEAKTVTCSTLDIRAANVIIRKSMLQDVDVTDANSAGASFTIEDSTVVNGARAECSCIGGHDFTVLRVEVRGGNRSAYCVSHCTIENSWLHGQQLEGAQHGSGLREEAFTTATHNVIVCDFPYYDDVTSLGCSADLTGYPDFAPIHDNTIHRNLFLATITSSFCAYGGASLGKPYSSDPLNATHQVFTENVFQRGSNGLCGYYGPMTDFDISRTGNVWSGNVWDNGGTVDAG